LIIYPPVPILIVHPILYVQYIIVFVVLLRDLKVIILGDYNVGKTALICRYIEGTFKTHEPVSCSTATYKELKGSSPRQIKK
jgi:GTPase SAR1 family protein